MSFILREKVTPCACLSGSGLRLNLQSFAPAFFFSYAIIQVGYWQIQLTAEIAVRRIDCQKQPPDVFYIKTCS